MVTRITVEGKNAFIFDGCLPCTVSIGSSQYYYRNITDVRNSKSMGIFKEVILNLLTTRKNDRL